MFVAHLMFSTLHAIPIHKLPLQLHTYVLYEAKAILVLSLKVGNMHEEFWANLHEVT